MKRLRMISGILPVLVILFFGFSGMVSATGSQTYETTILFTHDLHDHFFPQPDGEGGESGGYARLMTALERERERHPNALTVDGGDFSIGSLVQTLYTTQAPELRTMGAMGYDAVTVGNHEFDHEGTGFAQMLSAAVLSGDPVPPVLMANYTPAADDPDRLDIQRAMAVYGVQEYLLLERGGVAYGIFGLMGENSHDYAPASGFALEDRVTAAQRCVEALKEQGAQFIICLSHSGTNEKKSASEDERLAEEVDGIDLIVSGHTHTTLAQPIVTGDTYIVSAGSYCENLGSITLSWTGDGEKELVDYRLIPIDGTLTEDPEIAALAESWKIRVDSSYLASYGLTYDQVLTESAFSLDTPQSGIQEGNALGELVSDAFLWAAANLEADAPEIETVAVTADGVLRAPLFSGPVTVSQVFDVLSMGVGADGTSGYPLVGVYLTGKELRAVLEVDASVTPIMPEAQLYLSGIQYRFNTHRMFFNRIFEAQLKNPPFDSTFQVQGVEEIEDDRLYRVISGMYSAQMLGTVKDRSFGLLAIEPKDENGQPVTDFTQFILRDQNGNEIKEWYALASYLGSFGGSGIPEHYAAPDGRKAVSRSWNPIELVRSPNWLTFAGLVLLALLVVGITLGIRAVVRIRRRGRYSGRRRFPFLK